MWRISVLKYSGDPMNWNTVAEDFAGSIIKECVKVVHDKGETYSEYLIEKHFGVE
jgi:hypothetical protein